MITFYDRHGVPVAYSEDLETIYLFSGKPVAYFQNDSVYAFYGRHLGWFLNGWIRDHNGDAVYFTEIAQGGPLKPLKQLKPLKSLRLLRPLKSLRALKPLKPIKSFNWSSLSGKDFFQ